MQLCRGAERVLMGAFSCFSAICRELSQQVHVDILCAGTDGQITREDVLFAGAVVDDLVCCSPTPLELNDQAEIAADAWRNARRDFSALKPLADCLRASRGGRNLLEIGHERDIEIAAPHRQVRFCRGTRSGSLANCAPLDLRPSFAIN